MFRGGFPLLDEMLAASVDPNKLLAEIIVQCTAHRWLKVKAYVFRQRNRNSLVAEAFRSAKLEFSKVGVDPESFV